VSVAEARQNSARSRWSKLFDQLASQDAQRDRVEEQHSLSAEPQHPSLRLELQKLPEVQILRFIELITILSFR
jgi:hypothetical protein